MSLGSLNCNGIKRVPPDAAAADDDDAATDAAGITGDTEIREKAVTCVPRNLRCNADLFDPTHPAIENALYTSHRMRCEIISHATSQIAYVNGPLESKSTIKYQLNYMNTLII